MNRTIARRQRRRGPRTPRVPRSLFASAGGQTYTVKAIFSVPMTRAGTTSVYYAQQIINPFLIIQQSYSVGLLTMFAQFRVNSYSVRTWPGSVSTSSQGFWYSVLLRDTGETPGTTPELLNYISAQPFHKKGRLYYPQRHNWLPIEADDTNYEVFNPSTQYDYGRLLFYVDSSQAPGDTYVDISLNVTLIQRRKQPLEIPRSDYDFTLVESGDNTH